MLLIEISQDKENIQEIYFLLLPIFTFGVPVPMGKAIHNTNAIVVDVIIFIVYFKNIDLLSVQCLSSKQYLHVKSLKGE